jgi:hypothetical protein
VLPTGGAARSRGGLSASDFVRTTSVQRLTKKGLCALAPVALALAEAEGLQGHAASIAIRLGGRRDDWSDNQITQSPNHQINNQSPSHQITKSPNERISRIFPPPRYR